MPIRPALLVLTLLMAGAGSVQAQLYKWVDDEGNVQFTQTPPENREAESLDIKVSPGKSRKPAGENDNGAAGTEPAPPPSADVEREQLEAQVFKKNCEVARNNLDIYSQHRTIMENGKVTVLSDDERAKRIKESKDNIKKFCK